MQSSSLLWRRLDSPGHDACRIEVHASGCRINGTAVFRHDGQAASLDYEVACDSAWRTTRGRVRGFVGDTVVAVSIERTTAGLWSVDGRATPGFERFEHLDFGFTPATNFPQLQQLALAVGQGADIAVAWLDVPPGALQTLEQRYERRSELTYWYEAPRFGYTALLEVTPAGFIRTYPELWDLEA